MISDEFFNITLTVSELTMLTNMVVPLSITAITNSGIITTYSAANGKSLTRIIINYFLCFSKYSWALIKLNLTLSIVEFQISKLVVINI